MQVPTPAVTTFACTKWVTNDAGSGSQWVLSQQIDHNGNAITFHYDALPVTMTETNTPYGAANVPADGFPLLTSVTNGAGRCC